MQIWVAMFDIAFYFQKSTARNNKQKRDTIDVYFFSKNVLVPVIISR
jgi:hypothetical protein